MSAVLVRVVAPQQGAQLPAFRSAPVDEVEEEGMRLPRQKLEALGTLPPSAARWQLHNGSVHKKWASQGYQSLVLPATFVWFMESDKDAIMLIELRAILFWHLLRVTQHIERTQILPYCVLETVDLLTVSKAYFAAATEEVQSALKDGRLQDVIRQIDTAPNPEQV